MMQGHSIKSKHGARKKPGVLGRGASSGWGTTAGRGTKGQRARSGGRHRLAMFGSKHMIQSIPKLRGFKSLAKKVVAVTVRQLQKEIADGTIVTHAELVKAGLLRTVKTPVKIVGGAMGAKIEKKFTVSGIPVTGGAQKIIEAAGGKISAE